MSLRRPPRPSTLTLDLYSPKNHPYGRTKLLYLPRDHWNWSIAHADHVLERPERVWCWTDVPINPRSVKPTFPKLNAPPIRQLLLPLHYTSSEEPPAGYLLLGMPHEEAEAVMAHGDYIRRGIPPCLWWVELPRNKKPVRFVDPDFYERTRPISMQSDVES